MTFPFPPVPETPTSLSPAGSGFLFGAGVVKKPQNSNVRVGFASPAKAVWPHSFSRGTVSPQGCGEQRDAGKEMQ